MLYVKMKSVGLMTSEKNLFENVDEGPRMDDGYLYIYTWKKVREHLLCYEGKLWPIIFLQSKYVLTKPEDQWSCKRSPDILA